MTKTNVPKHVRVVVGFNGLNDHDVETTGNSVATGAVYANKILFAAPPVDQATLQAAAKDFTAAIAAAVGGGTKATSEKNKRRHTLIALLRKLALYVEANSGDDVAAVLATGFKVVTRKSAPAPLPKPLILSVNHGLSGQLVVKVHAIRNAKSYDLQYAPAVPAGVPAQWQSVGTFTSSRAMAVHGLTAGATYTVRVRAFGTSGYTDWSDPVSHMSI